MRQDLPLLRNVTIAKPCPASWDDMKGDDKVRHCSLCRLNVYNVSGMTSDEAEKLLGAKDHVCLRLYRRQDGTIITADCPKGMAAVRKRLATIAVATASLFIVGFTSFLPKTDEQTRATKERYARTVDYFENIEPIKTWIGKKEDPPILGKVAVMGAVAMPPPTKSPTPSKSGKP